MSSGSLSDLETIPVRHDLDRSSASRAASSLQAMWQNVSGERGQQELLYHVQVFEMFYDFLVDNEAQQGASLRTLNGLLGSAENATLFLLNGDVSYARSVLSALRSRASCPGKNAHLCGAVQCWSYKVALMTTLGHLRREAVSYRDIKILHGNDIWTWECCMLTGLNLAAGASSRSGMCSCGRCSLWPRRCPGCSSRGCVLCTATGYNVCRALRCDSCMH